MDSQHALQLILDNLVIYGLTLLSILGATVTIALGYLVFKYGKRLLYDNSITLGGYYLRNTPYKGYNRWRSQKWNIKNTYNVPISKKMFKQYKKTDFNNPI